MLQANLCQNIDCERSTIATTTTLREEPPDQLRLWTGQQGDGGALSPELDQGGVAPAALGEAQECNAKKFFDS